VERECGGEGVVPLDCGHGVIEVCRAQCPFNWDGFAGRLEDLAVALVNRAAVAGNLELGRFYIL